MDSYLRRPSMGMGLLFLLNGSIVAAMLWDGFWDWFAVAAYLLCAAISSYVVFRWLGGCLGYLVKVNAAGFMAGYRAARRREPEEDVGLMPGVWHAPPEASGETPLLPPDRVLIDRRRL